jgi:hypothetical protein
MPTVTTINGTEKLTCAHVLRITDTEGDPDGKKRVEQFAFCCFMLCLQSKKTDSNGYNSGHDLQFSPTELIKISKKHKCLVKIYNLK